MTDSATEFRTGSRVQHLTRTAGSAALPWSRSRVVFPFGKQIVRLERDGRPLVTDSETTLATALTNTLAGSIQ